MTHIVSDAIYLIQRGAVFTRSIFSQILTIDNNSLLVRARYGVGFDNDNSDIYSASVTVVLCAIPCHIGLRYNGT